MNYYTLKRYVENGWLPRLAVVVFSVCQTETDKLVKYDENVRHERAQVELGNHLINVYHGPAENSIPVFRGMKNMSTFLAKPHVSKLLYSVLLQSDHVCLIMKVLENLLLSSKKCY